ncbi:MAG: hypothetical protein CL472_11090 [Acidobacteria bacterium]|nr:hypothetical protein [Acidobacteriota bacterium]
MLGLRFVVALGVFKLGRLTDGNGGRVWSGQLHRRRWRRHLIASATPTSTRSLHRDPHDVEASKIRQEGRPATRSKLRREKTDDQENRDMRPHRHTDGPTHPLGMGQLAEQ